MLELGNINIKKNSISLEKIDPASIKSWQFGWMEGFIKFTVFNKLCASKVHLRCNQGGKTDTVDSFKIDLEGIKQLNSVIPNLKSIIEGSMDLLIKECNWFYNETHDKKEQKKITSADVIKHFSHVSSIGVEYGYKGDSYVLIGLEGTYPVWDAEHGIGLKVVNGKVVDCGQIGNFL